MARHLVIDKRRSIARGAALTEILLVSAFVCIAGVATVASFGSVMGCGFARFSDQITGNHGAANCAVPGVETESSAGSAPAEPGAPPVTSGGVLRTGTAFLDGLASAWSAQALDLANIFADPFGFASDLATLTLALLTDPASVLHAVADALGQDVANLLGGDAYAVGVAIGTYVTPLQIARIARVAKFASRVGRRTGCASFVAGTPVWRGTDSTAIEALSVGAPVHSRNERTYAETLRPVTRLLNRHVPVTRVISLADEDIVTTPEHPFWVQGRGWVEAHELQRGMALATAQGEVLVWATGERVEPVKVFNISVLHDVSYFVGKHRLWVHNANRDCDSSKGASESNDKEKLPTELQRELDDLGVDLEAIRRRMSEQKTIEYVGIDDELRYQTRADSVPKKDERRPKTFWQKVVSVFEVLVRW